MGFFFPMVYFKDSVQDQTENESYKLGLDILCWGFSSLNIFLGVSTQPLYWVCVWKGIKYLLQFVPPCAVFPQCFISSGILLSHLSVAAPSTWCATGRHASVLPWRKSTSRIWYWGTRSSRRLWRGTSSRLRRTPSLSPCFAPSRRGDTSAWSWSMLKVGERFTLEVNWNEKDEAKLLQTSALGLFLLSI